MSENMNDLPIPDFVDVDSDAVTAAESAAQRGQGWAIPTGTKVSDFVGRVRKMRHARWSESATVVQAYRSVTKTGLLDVTLVVKSRTGMPNENKSQFVHWYISVPCMLGQATEEQQKKHGGMTEQSIGAIATLLKATGLFPQSGGFKASLLNMIFPRKGEPGAKSPLDGKAVVVNAHATIEKKMVTTKNEETGESVTEETEDLRVTADTFSPDSTE